MTLWSEEQCESLKRTEVKGPKKEIHEKKRVTLRVIAFQIDRNLRRKLLSYVHVV